jgi:hypothetical protein
MIKYLRSRRRQGSVNVKQEFEEKQLLESLISGEQRISLQYAQDIREFGDLARIGDGKFTYVLK